MGLKEDYEQIFGPSASASSPSTTLQEDYDKIFPQQPANPLPIKQDFEQISQPSAEAQAFSQRWGGSDFAPQMPTTQEGIATTESLIEQNAQQGLGETTGLPVAPAKVRSIPTDAQPNIMQGAMAAAERGPTPPPPQRQPDALDYVAALSPYPKATRAATSGAISAAGGLLQAPALAEQLAGGAVKDVYNSFNKIAAKIASKIVNKPITAKAVTTPPPSEVSQFWREQGRNVQKAAQSIMPPMAKLPSQYIKEGDYIKAADSAISSLAQSAPLMGVMVLMSRFGMTPQGLGLVAASVGGQKKAELDAAHPEMPEDVKALNAAGTGAVEAVFERMGTAQWVKRLLANVAGKAAAKSIVRRVVTVLFPVLQEGKEEWLTQISQNAIDRLSGLKVGLFDGAWDAFGLGAISASPGSLVAGAQMQEARQAAPMAEQVSTQPPAQPPPIPQAATAAPVTPQAEEVAYQPETYGETTEGGVPAFRPATTIPEAKQMAKDAGVELPKTVSLPQANRIIEKAVGETKPPELMTYEELKNELESAVDKKSLDRIRPLLARIFPEYLNVDYRDPSQDPWGIGRAIQSGDELPRIPTTDLSLRHQAILKQTPSSAEPTAQTQVPPVREAVSAPTVTEKGGASLSPQQQVLQQGQQAMALEAGQRVRIKGKPLATYTVERQLPPQEGDLPNEAYFDIRNEKTGRVEKNVTLEELEAAPQATTAPKAKPDVDAELRTFGYEQKTLDAMSPKNKKETLVRVKGIAERQAARPLTDLSISELRARAKAQGLDTAGTEKGLIDRLTENAMKKMDAAADAARERLRKGGGMAGDILGGSGERVANLAVIGARHIMAGVRNFGMWAETMIREFGESIRPHLNDIWERSLRISDTVASTSDLEAGMKENRTVTRAAEDITAEPWNEVALRARAEGAAQVAVRSISQAQEDIAVTPTQDLQTRYIASQDALKKLDPNAFLVGMELVNRYRAEGRTEDAQAIANSLFKNDSNRAGYALRLVRELRTMTPEGAVSLVENLGASLTPQNRNTLLDLAQKNIDATTQLNLAMRDFWANPTEETMQNVKNVEKAAETAQRNWLTKAARVVPKSLPNAFLQVIQGNLLSPISLMYNLVGNMVILPAEQAVQSIGAMSDILSSKMSSQPRSMLMPFVSWGAGMRGLWGAIKRSGRVALTGQTGTIKTGGEIENGLRPFLALKELVTGENMPKTGKIKDRVARAVEGVLGLTAAPMLRGLAIGDVLQKDALRAQYVDEALLLKGIEGEKRRMFQEIVPPEILAKADELAKGQVFQQDSSLGNITMQFANAGKNIPYIGEWLNLGFRTMSGLIYAKTPANIVDRYAEYLMPGYGAAKMGIRLKQGDHRAAQTLMARMVIGASMHVVAATLMAWGVLRGKATGEEEKEREAKKATGGLNVLNWSKLMRRLEGKDDGTWRPGDQTYKFMYMGPQGMAMNVYANGLERQLLQQRHKSLADAPTLIGTIIPEIPAAALDMSVLNASADLMDAIRKREWGRYLQNEARLAASVFIPSTANVIGRSMTDYMVDTTVDDVVDRVAYAIKQQTGQYDDLPKALDMWGRPVKAVPEGRNAFVYNMFDVTKGQKTPNDLPTWAAYRTFEETGDLGALPSPVERRQPRIQKEPLSEVERRELSQLVGAERLKVMNRVIQSPSFWNESKETRLKMLEHVYAGGRKEGIRKFIENRKRLKPVPETE